MQGSVAAIFRHPVKGFTPEPLQSVSLTVGRGVAFDRLYAVENGPSGFAAAAPVFIPQQQFTVLAGIALVMTVGVYGLVAGIVKLDDAGLYLTQRGNSLAQKAGRAILWGAPFLMKSLSILGTAAMFLVGGGILTHGIPWLHHLIQHSAGSLKAAGGAGPAFALLTPSLLNGLVGLMAGAFVLVAVAGIRKFRGKAMENQGDLS